MVEVVELLGVVGVVSVVPDNIAANNNNKILF